MSGQSKILEMAELERIKNTKILKTDSPKIILKGFKEWLLLEGKSDKTIYDYHAESKRFIKWLAKQEIVFRNEIKRLDIINYRRHLIDVGLSARFINFYIASLASFNKYLITKSYQEHLVVIPSIDNIKIAIGSRNSIQVLSFVELDLILEYLDKAQKMPIRDKLIIYLLMYIGIRASELTGIEINDIDLPRQLLIIKYGKGGIMREVPLIKDLSDRIYYYIEGERKNHKLSSSPFLFVSERSDSIHRHVTNYAVKKLGEDLNLEIYPHKFRRTFATSLIRKGVNITTVSYLLGHSSIETTVSFYLNVSHQEKIDAVELL